MWGRTIQGLDNLTVLDGFEGRDEFKKQLGGGSFLASPLTALLRYVATLEP